MNTSREKVSSNERLDVVNEQHSGLYEAFFSSLLLYSASSSYFRGLPVSMETTCTCCNHALVVVEVCGIDIIAAVFFMILRISKSLL